MAAKYVRTTAKERKAADDERAMGMYLVAHRNWGYDAKQQLVVYRKCVDVSPSVGSTVVDSYDRRYYLNGHGNLIRLAGRAQRKG